MLHAQFITAAGAKSLCCPHISQTKHVFSTAVCGAAGEEKGNVIFPLWETYGEVNFSHFVTEQKTS